MPVARETHAAKVDHDSVKSDQDELRYVPPPGAAPAAPPAAPPPKNTVPAPPESAPSHDGGALLQDLIDQEGKPAPKPRTNGTGTTKPGPLATPAQARSVPYTGKQPPQPSVKPSPPARQPRPQTASAPTTEQATAAQPVRDDTSDGWWDRMIAEGFALLLSCALWGGNAYFTIVGLQFLFLPTTILGGAIGLGIHIGISKMEQYIWRGGVTLPAGLLGGTALFIDVGTAFLGMMTLGHERLTGVMGDFPAEISGFGSLLLGIIGQGPIPDWWWLVLVLLVLAIGIALAPERLVRHFWRRVRQVWSLRQREGVLSSS